MQSLCTTHTVWDSWQLQCLLGQELTDMGAHWTKGEKSRIWREYLSIPQSPKQHVLETMLMQTLISRSTNWNTNMWQSQLLVRAYPALLLTAPKKQTDPVGRPQKSPTFSRESAAHTSHLCITQLLSLFPHQMHMVCLNLGQLDPRLKQILQKRYIPSHSWQSDPKLRPPLLQDRETPWKLHLKWGVWLRLEPLSRTAPANIWTLTSSLILLWGQSVHKTKLTQKYYQKSSSALITRSMYFQRTWVVLLQCCLSHVPPWSEQIRVERKEIIWGAAPRRDYTDFFESQDGGFNKNYYLLIFLKQVSHENLECFHKENPLALPKWRQRKAPCIRVCTDTITFICTTYKIKCTTTLRDCTVDLPQKYQRRNKKESVLVQTRSILAKVPLFSEGQVTSRS